MGTNQFRHLKQHSSAVASAAMHALESRVLMANDPLGVSFSRGVLTVVGTLLTARFLRRRRSR